MIKILTEFLSAGVKPEQPKMSPQGGEQNTPTFANTMGELLASVTNGSEQLAPIDESKELVLSEPLSLPESHWPKQSLQTGEVDGSVIQAGQVAQKSGHVIEAGQIHQVMDDLTMDIMKPGQDAPKTSQGSVTDITVPMELAADSAGLSDEQNNPANFQETMIDLTSGSTQSQTVPTDEAVESQNVRTNLSTADGSNVAQDKVIDLTSASTQSQVASADEAADSENVEMSSLMANGSPISPEESAMSSVATSAQPMPQLKPALSSADLSAKDEAVDGVTMLRGEVAATGSPGAMHAKIVSSNTLAPSSATHLGPSSGVTNSAISTEITLDMVETGRKLAGRLPESPINTTNQSPAPASPASVTPSLAATRETMGVENSIARTLGTPADFAESFDVTKGVPLTNVSDRSPADPRFDAATDRTAVSSTAALAKAEQVARQSYPLDPGIKLSSTEPQQFAGEMATHVRVLKSQSGGEVKLNLHPAALGRMSISVATEGNETRVAFVVETSQARQAVEAALPRLRDMLENAGLSLSDSDVSEQGDSQAGFGGRDSGRSSGNTTSSDSDDGSATTVLSLMVDPDRLVDTYI